MDRTDLNRLFTEKVTELIAQGYVINTGSMRGSQGEIAKVDLRKGDEIIRVMMLHNSRWSSGYDYNGIFEIIVSRNTDRILDNWDDTLWSHHMEVISQIELARVSNNHFVSLEEAREIVNKRNARWRAKRKPNRKVLGEASPDTGRVCITTVFIVLLCRIGVADVVMGAGIDVVRKRPKPCNTSILCTEV